MNEFNRNKTLTELEETDWGEPNYDSSLVNRCHDLRYKPIKDFTIEDLRIMIGQAIGLDYLIPMAIEVLQDNPLAEGDMYSGDLLEKVLKADMDYWIKNPAIQSDLDVIIKNVIPVLSHIKPAFYHYLTIRNMLHICDGLTNFMGKMKNFECMIYKLQSNWYLNTSYYANEKMVQDGEAEDVGDEICGHEFIIRFCPFCGSELE